MKILLLPPNKKYKNCFKKISNILHLWYRMSRFCCDARRQANAGIISISTPDLVTLKHSFNKTIESLENTDRHNSSPTCYSQIHQVWNCFFGEMKKASSSSVTLTHWKKFFFRKWRISWQISSSMPSTVAALLLGHRCSKTESLY